MSTAQLIEKYLSLPKSMRKELDRFIELLLDRSKQDEAKDPSPLANLDLEGYDLPINLDEFRLSQEDLKSLQDVWEGEEDAETLCQLLTA